MAAFAPVVPLVLHLSLVVGGELRDAGGGKLGRVDDLIVRLGEDEYPPVSGVLATVAGRPVFVPADQVAEIALGRVTLRPGGSTCSPSSAADSEVLLKKDVLDRQLINVDGARLVRANEIELARMRRLVPRRRRRHRACAGSCAGSLPRVARAARVGSARSSTGRRVEPFTGHVPTVRLRVPHPKLARLHPAAARRPRRGGLAPRGRGDHRPRSAATRSSRPTCSRSSRPSTSSSSSRSARTREIAALLERMETDDAADLVGSSPRSAARASSRCSRGVQRRRVRALLGYDPATAGGLMSPEFVCVYAQATGAEALERVAALAGARRTTLAWVFVMNTRQRLRGGDPARRPPARRRRSCASASCASPSQRVRPDADLEEVARLMTDYDLTVVPVDDEHDQLVGVITVDDVLELVLPRGWRRRFGVLGGE